MKVTAEFTQERSMQTKYGPRIKWAGQVEGEGDVEALLPPGVHPPTVGNDFPGNVKSNEYGKTLWADQKWVNQHNGSSASQGQSGGGATGGRDDATGRSIERQVAAKIASDHLAPHYTAGMEDDAGFQHAAKGLTNLWADAIRGE